MGGWKNLIINVWVRHNGGVDLKMGGGRGVILSKVILVPQKILSKTSTFWPNTPKILSKCIPELSWQNWHKIHFLLHFHAWNFSNNSFKWINFLCAVLFWVSNCLKIGQLVTSFNVKKVKQKPLEVCITWKVFWNFTSFQATKTTCF